jgi:hypothetical protein
MIYSTKFYVTLPRHFRYIQRDALMNLVDGVVIPLQLYLNQQQQPLQLQTLHQQLQEQLECSRKQLLLIPLQLMILMQLQFRQNGQQTSTFNQINLLVLLITLLGQLKLKALESVLIRLLRVLLGN